MLEVVAVVAWGLFLPFFTPTVHAQDIFFNMEDLMSPAVLTRSNPQSDSCVTPEGLQGVCGLAIRCQEYLPLLSNRDNRTVLFFRERVCRHEPGFIHVCCPLETLTEAPRLHSAPVRPAHSMVIHRPSQRPNARQPAQEGFEREQEDKEELHDEKIAFIPSPFQPQPPPRPPPRPLPTAEPRPVLLPIPIPTTTTTTTTTTTITTTTTTPRPILLPAPRPPSTGIFMSTDREPLAPPSRTPPSPPPKDQNTPPEEPSVPPILPDGGSCGQGGEAAAVAMPWMASVGILEQTKFQISCGASLISQLHVLTAAHCMNAPFPTHVRLGGLQEGDTPVDVAISTWIHPGYNPASRENDLALLTLAKRVTFTDKIQPVCLPFPYRLDGFRGQDVQVVGWNAAGSVETGIVQILGLGRCRKVYKSPALVSNNIDLFSRSSSSSASSLFSSSSFSSSSSSNLLVDRRHLCGSPAPTASSTVTCLSDFGAPLFYHDNATTGVNFVVGVSSLGEGCGAGPGLYTRVGAFLPWLVEQLSKVETPALAISARFNPFHKADTNWRERLEV